MKRLDVFSLILEEPLPGYHQNFNLSSTFRSDFLWPSISFSPLLIVSRSGYQLRAYLNQMSMWRPVSHRVLMYYRSKLPNDNFTPLDFITSQLY